MIRMVQSRSAEHAKSYFSDALTKADYYINDQELQGSFHGKLAQRLGMEGITTKEAFFALCENRHPQTGKPLTRHTRTERTVGYDINFHVPKSVSILHALSGDDHILNAFTSSVRDTMRDIEADSKTRVRINDTNEDRETGELIYAEFVHQTARPVDGALPDPHLHAHCYVFNATYDKQEDKIKAAQFRDIMRDMPYYQAKFHKRLSDNLLALGYQVERTDKSFEIIGVPGPVIDLFSKRTDEIGRVAREKGITDAQSLDALGARTRAKKQKGLSMAELKTGWRDQIVKLGGEGNTDTPVRYAPVKGKLAVTPEHCVEHAITHAFERTSVKAERRILETAYRHGIGDRNTSLDAISEAFGRDESIIHVQEKGRTLCTTKDVLAEEKHMIDLARTGRGMVTPLYYEPPTIKLKEQQGDAVKHVLTTKNRVSMIRGGAGTGKTTLMQEAAEWIEKAGKRLTVVAPTAEAARGVLRKEGFKQAETVAQLLTNHDIQRDLQDQVLWVDEAGLLGVKDMTALLDLATRKNARIILSGDTKAACQCCARGCNAYPQYCGRPQTCRGIENPQAETG